MTITSDYELTIVTINDDSDKPGKYVAMHRIKKNDSTNFESFKSYLLSVRGNSVADKAMRAASSGRLDKTRYFDLEAHQADKLKNEAIAAVDTSKFTLLNSNKASAKSLRMTAINAARKDIAKCYKQYRDQFPDILSTADKTKWRNEAVSMIVDRGLHLEVALNEAFILLRQGKLQ